MICPKNLLINSNTLTTSFVTDHWMQRESFYNGLATHPPKTRTFFRKVAIIWDGLRILKKILADIYRSSWALCACFRSKNDSLSVKKWFQVQNVKLFWKQFFQKIQHFIFIAFLAFSGPPVSGMGCLTDESPAFAVLEAVWSLLSIFSSYPSHPFHHH